MTRRSARSAITRTPGARRRHVAIEASSVLEPDLFSGCSPNTVRSYIQRVRAPAAWLSDEVLFLDP